MIFYNQYLIKRMEGRFRPKRFMEAVYSVETELQHLSGLDNLRNRSV